jgi:hypothetical protein
LLFWAAWFGHELYFYSSGQHAAACTRPALPAPLASHRAPLPPPPCRSTPCCGWRCRWWGWVWWPPRRRCPRPPPPACWPCWPPSWRRW